MYVSQEGLEYLGNTCGLICFLDMLVSSHSSTSARTADPVTVITVTEGLFSVVGPMLCFQLEHY